MMATAVAMAPAASGWYGPAVSVSPSSATPGATVNVKGDSFDQDDPVVARLDGLDGPITATFTPDSGAFSGPLVVPTDIKPGSHVLVFMQYNAARAIEEIPTRALLVVTSQGSGSPLAATPLAIDTSIRPASLALSRSHGLGFGTLALIALASAGLAALVAGITIAVTSSRPGGTATPVVS